MALPLSLSLSLSNICVCVRVCVSVFVWRVCAERERERGGGGVVSGLLEYLQEVFFNNVYKSVWMVATLICQYHENLYFDYTPTM